MRQGKMFADQRGYQFYETSAMAYSDESIRDVFSALGADIKKRFTEDELSILI